MQLIVNLFTQLEHLKTGMNIKEIVPIIQYLLSKTKIKIWTLFFLCISEISKIFLREFTVLIEREKWLDYSFIKFVNHDMYLWW
jgi:hypothetical protein